MVLGLCSLWNDNEYHVCVCLQGKSERDPGQWKRIREGIQGSRPAYCWPAPLSNKTFFALTKYLYLKKENGKMQTKARALQARLYGVERKGERSMRKRKWTALVMALSLLGVLVFPVWAEETGYADVEGHYAQSAIEAWSGYGVLKGYPDGTFRPDDGITRAELAAVLDRIMGYQRVAEDRFVDLPNSPWCAEHLLHLAAEGIFQGDPSGAVRPGASITRQEAFTALARVLALEESGKAPGFTDDDAIADWAKGYIAAMREAGYVSGDKTGQGRSGGRSSLPGPRWSSFWTEWRQLS